MRGAHALKREILGSKYPRRYNSSVIGATKPLITRPRSAVITNIDFEYSSDNDKKNQLGSHENRFMTNICAIGGYTTTKIKLPYRRRRMANSTYFVKDIGSR